MIDDTNWYKKAQNSMMLETLIGSYFQDESQLNNLMIFITNYQIGPQDVQAVVQQREPQLYAIDPQMYNDKKARLFNAMNGMNYNPTVDDVNAPLDQQTPQQDMMNAEQIDTSDIAGSEGEI